MFSALLDAARNSPFKVPLSRAQCEASEKSLVPSSDRTIQAAATKEVEFGSNEFFGLCALGGILSCGLTHTAVVPLDLVKCRLQVDPVKYKNLFHGFKLTVAEEGARGLAKGWAPTFFGYSAQVSQSGRVCVFLSSIFVLLIVTCRNSDILLSYSTIS